MEKHGPIIIEKPCPASLSSSTSRNSLPLTSNDDLSPRYQLPPSPPSPEAHETFTIVSFEPNDSSNPYNWPTVSTSPSPSAFSP